MSGKQLALVDAHCHIDLFGDPQQVVEETESHRVYTIAVTNAPSVYTYTESITRDLKYIRAAVGLHPELVNTRKHELSQMWQILERTRYVGEIGLDYRIADESDRQTQMQVLVQILDQCAGYGNKVLTVHSRRAAGDVISAIDVNFPGKVILHWYSGSVKELNRAVHYGFYFSVNSAMVKSKKGRDTIQRIPRERLLTETDGPFIKIVGEPARPRHVLQTIEALSSLWGITRGETQRQLISNFRDILC